MECPYCKGIMKQGFINGSREITWNAKKRVSGMSLPGSSGWMGTCVLSYLCRDCKKIIIEYDE